MGFSLYICIEQLNKMYMKKLVFTVEVEFADNVNADNEINEVADNILRGLTNEVNHGVGLVPEDSETFTTKLTVSNQVSNYDVEKVLFMTKKEKDRAEQITKLGNYVSECEDENGVIQTVGMQFDSLIKALEKGKLEGKDKRTFIRADYVEGIQMVEAYELYYSVYELLDVIGYPVWK